MERKGGEGKVQGGVSVHLAWTAVQVGVVMLQSCPGYICIVWFSWGARRVAANSWSPVCPLSAVQASSQRAHLQQQQHEDLAVEELVVRADLHGAASGCITTARCTVKGLQENGTVSIRPHALVPRCNHIGYVPTGHCR